MARDLPRDRNLGMARNRQIGMKFPVRQDVLDEENDSKGYDEGSIGKNTSLHSCSKLLAGSKGRFEQRGTGGR